MRYYREASDDLAMDLEVWDSSRGGCVVMPFWGYPRHLDSNLLKLIDKLEKELDKK